MHLSRAAKHVKHDANQSSSDHGSTNLIHSGLTWCNLLKFNSFHYNKKSLPAAIWNTMIYLKWFRRRRNCIRPKGKWDFCAKISRCDYVSDLIQHTCIGQGPLYIKNQGELSWRAKRQSLTKMQILWKYSRCVHSKSYRLVMSWL